jgi:hypothetical protein
LLWDDCLQRRHKDVTRERVYIPRQPNGRATNPAKLLNLFLGLLAHGVQAFRAYREVVSFFYSTVTIVTRETGLFNYFCPETCTEPA